MVGFIILNSVSLNLLAKILGNALGELLKETIVLKCEI